MKAILLSGVGGLVFLFAAHAVAQPTPAPKAIAAPTPIVAPAPVVPSVVAPQPVENAIYPQYGRPARDVHLRNDGNFVGRIVGPHQVEGERVTRARIVLAQLGNAVHSTRSDDTGYFQIAGVRVGAYTVIVAAPTGFSVFAVRVEPFHSQPTAQKNPNQVDARFANMSAQADNGDVLTLEVNSLVPPADGVVVTQVLTEEGIVPVGGLPAGVGAPAFAPGMGAMGGGGAGGAAGGGLGLGGLLGAAGLGVGLGGIGGQGGGAQPPASGTVPTP